jgi:hypothetical protein
LYPMIQFELCDQVVRHVGRQPSRTWPVEALQQATGILASSIKNNPAMILRSWTCKQRGQHC